MYIQKNSFLKTWLLVLTTLFCLQNVDAQFTASWALTTNKTAVVAGTQAAAVSVGAMFPASNLANPGSHTTDGYEVTPIGGYIGGGSSNYWPTAFNDITAIVLPLSPKTGFDVVINTFSITTKRSNSSGENTAILSYRANGTGPWNYIGTSKIITTSNSNTVTSFTGLNTTFYNGGLYEIKVHFAADQALTTKDNRRLYIKNLVINGDAFSPPFIVPSVTTGFLGTATKYTNTLTNSFYSITNAGVNLRPVSKSGVCFSTNTTPTLTNSTATIDAATNGAGNASFNSSIAGLTPGTTYYVRAYALTQVDTVYGNIVTFQTLPPSAPTLSTNSATNVLSNKATSGGNTIDSGGFAVTAKGICYSSVTNNPTTANSKTTDGSGNANFTSFLKGLSPSTKYYIRAYATNSIGTGYGNLDSFTTLAPVSIITVSPAVLDFGDITYGTAAPILSYKINAAYLAPALAPAGNITLTPSAGYSISTKSSGPYSTTPLLIAYTGSTITNKIIYVKSSTTPYGNLAGTVLHTGGGTVAPNADTVFMNTNVVQSQDTLSNAGSDFWCGFGYQDRMKEFTNQFDTGTGAKGSHLNLFIAAGNQGDSVIVDLPGILNAPTFPRRVYVPANGVVEIGGFPVGTTDEFNGGNGPDARLFYTGVSKRGIHITSKNGIPVSAWLYDWQSGDAAGGAMLFPTNTWNSSYIVQSVGGKANNSGYFNNSFFFVIAKDDNTLVSFKPTNDILDSNSSTIFSNKHSHTPVYVKYKKDSTYNILLNKGEIFNAMGFVGDPNYSNTTDPGALDLSGTVVSTSCDKKIAVFGGNGRCVLGTAGSNPTTGIGCNNPQSGSDNLIQQMFPKVAWGTTYLTVPTKNMANNLFRIYVQDVNTNVSLNGTLLLKANLINGLYYQFDANKPCKIESNIPVSVTQFIISGYCVGGIYGNIGDGDPEMITLSPVQQSIKSTTFYSAIFKNGNTVPSQGASYVNVVVKGIQGVNTFLLDGLSNNADTGTNTFSGSKYAQAGSKISMINAFKKHPQDSNYYYATFWVSSKAKHTLSSSSGFNAIAYGVSKGESYGYNAGTAINNLSAVKFSLNPYGTDTSTGSVKTCKDNLVTLQIALPYDTSTINSIIWDAGSDATRYTPTGPNAGAINPSTSKPVVIGTIVKDGRTFYIYKSPVQYQFFEEGAFKVKVTISGTFASDCGGLDIQYMNVILGHDDIAFTAIPASCGSKDVQFTDTSTPLAGTSIVKWMWDFGDGKKDTVLAGASSNPTLNPHTYPANNTYNIKLTTVNSVGCFTTDTTHSVDLAFAISSTFTIAQDTICPGGSGVFAPNSSANAAKWFWDYGDGTIDSVAFYAPISHIYTTSGNYKVKHWVKTAKGCPSAVDSSYLNVTLNPIADFVLPDGICLPGETVFINISDTNKLALLMPYTYHWKFGIIGATNDTSNIKNPSFTYPNIPPPAGGYLVSLTASNRFGCISAVKTKPLTNIFPRPTAIIANTSDQKACVGSAANFADVSTATNQAINAWHWNFGDGVGISAQKNPSYTFSQNKLDTVTLYIETQEGCRSDTAKWVIKVNPKPVANTILPSSCFSSGGLFFQDKSTVAIDDSIQTPYQYTWAFGDASGTFTTKDSTHTYAGAGTYIINHSITTLNGCTDTKVDTFKIESSKPIPRIYVDNLNQSCITENIILHDSSTIAIGSIKRVEINWDYNNTLNLNAPNEVDLNPSNGSPGSVKIYTHKYPRLSGGNFTIMLYAFANNSCYDSTNPYGNIVRKVPIAKFDDLPGVCVDGAPKYIKFAYDSSNLTSLLIKSITYSGVGIDTDTLFHPNIAGAGNHQIKVVYETKTPINRPCKDSAYANIRVWALPSVKVDTALVKCEKTGVQFFDKSIADPTTSGIKSWKWNFGDSGKDTIKNPTHIYNNYGTYNITLKVTSDSGCTNTLTPPIRIRVNPNPVASFIPPSGVCVGQASSFTDNSTIADGSESFFNHSWNFGDPTSASNLVSGTHNPTPSHFYSGGATDTIRLVVTSNNGCVDSTKTPVNNAITFPPITPVYKINGVAWDTLKTKSVCLNAPLTFTSAFKANDYRWSFADTVGIINKGATVTHIYPTVKNFVGSFSMIDTNGCQTKAVPIKIAVWGLPNPIIQVSNPTCEKDSIHFTDNTLPVTNTGNISGWLWKFGEPSSGKYDSSKLQYPAHLYATFGSYNIYLTATSDSGCVATNTVATLVNVHPKPKVAITLPTAVCSPNAAVFNDASTIADGSEAQFMHFWNFGEPTSLSNTATGKPLPQASHIYSIAPTDSIRLKISSMDGCIDSIAVKMPANIIHPKPIAAYTVNGLLKDTAKACSNTAINFKDASNVAASVNYWVWGDNGLVVENGSPKAHSYTAAASQYFVGQHYIDDIYGCRSDTTKLLAYIHALPNPAIKIDAPTCEKNDVNFHDNSTASAGTGGLNAWLWNFGDLTTATTTNPTHKYTKAGKYYITLKVTDNSGCTATALVDSVTVHPLPNVRFSVPTSICLPNASATFTDLSTIADGTDTAFVQSWNFGDPSSGTLNNIIGKQKTVVTHIYDSSKLYTIQLTVTSKDGCVDSSKNNIDANIIHPQPIADYIVSSNAKTMDKDTPRVCVYSKIDFKDLSTNVKTSRWNWGDGTFNNGIKASYYQINDPGTYYGSHVITDNFNCTSLPLDFVVVIEKNPTVADGKQFILEGRSELLTPVILDAASVKWTINYPNNSFANYLDADDIETPRCTPLVDSIVYKIEAESEAHCKPNIDHYYTVIRFHTPTIPNAFSPNGDKVNDTWDLSSLTHFTGSTVQVFNRYGQVVLNKFAKSWDGNDMSGNPLPMGTYYYIIKVGLGYPMMSGSVTILR